MADIPWKGVNDSEPDLKAIGFLVKTKDLKNVETIISDTLERWGVENDCKKEFVAAILVLTANYPRHRKIAKKLRPGIDISLAISILYKSIDEDYDGREKLMDYIKMRSILIFLYNKLVSNHELYDKFKAGICVRIGLHSKNFKDLFDLFKKMESNSELTPDNMNHIEEALSSYDDFKSIQTEYNDQKQKIFQPKKEEESHRPVKLETNDYSKSEPESTTDSGQYSYTATTPNSTNLSEYGSNDSLYASNSSIVVSNHPPMLERRALSLNSPDQSPSPVPRDRIHSFPKPNQPHPLSKKPTSHLHSNQVISTDPRESPVLSSPLSAQDTTLLTKTTTLSTYTSDKSTPYYTNADYETPHTIMESAIKCIQLYIAMPDIPSGDFFSPWPKLDRTRYVTLALVTNHSITRDDDFTHRTLRKSEDDIPHHKYSIVYEDVFPQTLTKSSRILISGRPGAGKTVLLTKVVKDWANGKCLTNVKLLLHVSLRELVTKTDKPKLEDIISINDPSRPHVIHSLCDDINKLNGEGVCFALDGLDEYPNRSKRYDYVMKLILKEYLPQASVILTSRPTATSTLRKESIDKHIEIVGFMPDQIKEYITDYYETHTGSTTAGNDLVLYLEKHPNVMGMCYLPLHLAMILYINQYKETEDLPETETDIYSCFIGHSIIRYVHKEKPESEDKELSISNMEELENELAEENKEELELFYDICYLAFETKVASRLIFDSRYLKAKFPQRFGRRSDITRLRKNGLGILSRCLMKSQYGLESQFSFQHLTVQEFLGAFHLSRQDSSECLKFIKTHGKSSDLREFWRYFCGIIKSSQSFIAYYNELISVNSEGRSDTLFLARCLFEAQGAADSQECCTAFLKSRAKEGAVDVSDIVLNSPDCSAIGYSISQCPQLLKELLMNYCQVGPEGINALNYQMGDLTFPKTWNMQIRSQVNPVGGDGGINLKRILKKMPNLHELRLYGNQLSNNALLELRSVVEPMENLRILVLTRNNLGPKSGEIIGTILHNKRNLIQFYASYNPIGTEGLEALMPGLLNCTNLERLGFRGCQLTSDSGKLLGQMLSQLPKLQQLELYWNELEDDGVTDMVYGLRNAPHLKQVSMTKNGITDKGGCLLAEEVIKSSASIEQIRLYYNEVSFKTRKAFYDAVKYREQTGLNDLRYAI